MQHRLYWSIYHPDVDSNIILWGIVNVECGTNYGQVELLKDKESVTVE